MNRELIFAGFGGQGVMSMGMALAYAAMFEGKHVSWLPSYGPEQRGGTANCMVVISDEPVASPLITDAGYAVVMNGPSLRKFAPHVKRDGILFINSSLVDAVPERDDIKVVQVPAVELAREVGDDRVANMVMLGAVVAATGVVRLEMVNAALRKILPHRRRHLIEVNEKALERGAAFAKAG